MPTDSRPIDIDITTIPGTVVITIATGTQIHIPTRDWIHVADLLR